MLQFFIQIPNHPTQPIKSTPAQPDILNVIYNPKFWGYHQDLPLDFIKFQDLYFGVELKVVSFGVLLKVVSLFKFKRDASRNIKLLEL